VGDGCQCPHLEWLLQLLLQEHLEGCVVGALGDCKNALSTVTLQTPGRTAGFHRQPLMVLTALYFSVSAGKFSESILDFTAAETLFAFQSNLLGPLLFVMPKCPALRTSKAFVLLHISGKNSLSPLFYDGQRALGYPTLVLCV